jgi:hypothetical protein
MAHPMLHPMPPFHFNAHVLLARRAQTPLHTYIRALHGEVRFPLVLRHLASHPLLDLPRGSFLLRPPPLLSPLPNPSLPLKV